MGVSQSKIHGFPDESDTLKSFIEFYHLEDAVKVEIDDVSKVTLISTELLKKPLGIL